MARVVFGADMLDDQTAPVDAVLANNAYPSGHLSVKQRHQPLAFILLLNHSPWLDDLSWAALDRAASIAITHAASIILNRITKALVLLGIIAPGADAATRDPFLWARATAFRTSGTHGTAPGVPPGLEGWRHVWRAT